MFGSSLLKEAGYGRIEECLCSVSIDPDANKRHQDTIFFRGIQLITKLCRDSATPWCMEFLILLQELLIEATGAFSSRVNDILIGTRVSHVVETIQVAPTSASNTR